MSTGISEIDQFISGRRWIRSRPARYGVALLAVVLATLARYLLGVSFGLQLPFILFYPAILLAGLLGGFGPGMLATILSMASAVYFFNTQISVIAGSQARIVTWLVMFFLAGTALSTLGELARRNQHRLREFERLVEGLDQGIIVVDRDYRYVIANQVFQTYRGMEKQQILGRSIADFMDPKTFAERVKPKLDQCFNGKVIKYEKKYAYSGIGERDFSVTYFPISGPRGIDRVGCIFRDVTEKKQADNALRLFRTLIDQSNDAVEVADPETLRFLDVNQKACDELGYTREEMLSLTVFDINPEINPMSRGRVISQIQESGAAVFQTFHRRKDGSTFPVEVSIRRVEADRGYMVAITRNITDRKKGEHALRESEDRYRDLVEHSEDLLCTHDLQGRLLSVNPAPARILGYTVEELLNIPMRELVIPEGRELFDAYLERLRTMGGPEKGLLCVLTRSGEIRTWQYYNTLRTDGPERIVRGMAHDITDQRKAELALRDSEQRYRALFEKNIAGVAISSTDGEILECNEAWARMLGYESGGELRGHNAEEFYFDLADRGHLVDELTRKGSFLSQELRLRRKDGAMVWILFDCVVRRGESGGDVMQATAIDITERKQAEEALFQNEERFRIALKDSPITVFNQDRELRYTWIYNPRLYWQKEILGKTDDEILGARKALKLTELKKKVLDSGMVMREEVVVPHDGKNFAFDITIEPLFDANKRIVGITGASMDIARLRELADSLQYAKEKLTQEKSYLEKEIESELGFEAIVGQSPSLREVLKKARVVAPTDSTVLLLGETGTGKELVARSVHALSSRAERSFIKLNCAAVPSGLLESELFGHEKGAFTGAVNQKLGRLEVADQGTLFLDEIGELPVELQPKLLRVLQDREFERLGGVRTLRVDVRIIAATNRDLRQDIADRKFREDLFYRLNVFPIQLPSLRDRRSDIPLLVHHFVAKYAARMNRHIDEIPDETMEILQNWNWPGNVRELENMIERMVILTKGRVLTAPPVELEAPQEFSDDNLTEMEREHIIRVLRETNGVLSGADGAASRLGIKRTTLQSMLKRFGIELHEYRRGTGTYGRE